MKRTAFTTVLMAAAFLSGSVFAASDGKPKAETFPWIEDFNSETFPPEGWTQIQMEGTSLWQLGDAGWMGTMERQTSAYHPAASGMQHTALVSPAIVIPDGANSYDLTFWSNMTYTYTSYDYSGIWVSTTSATDFSTFEEVYVIPKDVSVTSPNMNAAQFGPVSLDKYKGKTVYLALVYRGDNAHKWYVDDVTINELAPSGTFTGDASVDMGIVFNNADLTIWKEYSVANTGAAELTISAVASVTEGVSVEGDFPLTLAPGKDSAIAVGLNAHGLPAGDYAGSFTLTTDDPAHQNVTVAVSGQVEASAYGFEDFNQVEDLSNGLPYGWQMASGDIRELNWEPYEGVDNSGHLVYQGNGTLQTYWYGMGQEPKVAFFLQAIRYDGNGVPFPATHKHFTYDVLISENGEDWESLAEDASLEEVSEFSRIELDAKAYAGKTCMLRFVFKPNGAIVDAKLDNVAIGTAPAKDLEVVSLTGSTRPIAGVENAYMVNVRNNGSETQSSYTVKLLAGDGTELASAGGGEISNAASKEVSLHWTPSVEGEASLRAVVVLEGDELAANDTLAGFAVKVLPGSMHSVSVGKGDALVRAPMDMSDKQSLAQVLYFPEEIGTNGGKITGLIYKSKFSDTCSAPVRVWVGETGLSTVYNAHTAEFCWTDPDSLTEVFDGLVHVSNIDKSDVVIEFDEPYEYKGGALLVYTYMNDTKFHGSMTQFYGTSEPGLYRTLMKYTSTSTLDPETPVNTGDMSYYFEERPNTTFLMDMSEAGALTGVVKGEDGEPLSGAQVHVLGSVLADSADAEGRYAFEFVAAGQTQVEAMMHGYITDTQTIAIQARQENTLDFSLEAYKQYALSGKVSSAGSPDGLSGVKVSVNGYDSYADTTAEDGTYRIEGIYDAHEYAVSFVLPGYTTVDTAVAFTGKDIVLDAKLTERPLPVHHATLEIEDGVDAQRAVVSWSSPALPQTFRYDNGTFEGNLGYSDGTYNGVFGSVHRIPSQLTKMEWFLGDMGGKQEKVNIFVFDLDEDGNPTNEILYTNLVETDTMKWSSYEFPMPVDCPNGFFIAVSRAGSGNVSIGLAFGDEEYPVVENTQYYGDYTVGYSILNTLSGYENCNFMIRAEGAAFGQSAKFGPAKETKSVRASASIFNPEVSFMAVQGNWRETGLKTDLALGNAKAASGLARYYVVYRLEQKASEDKWVEVAKDLTDTVFTDAAWATLETGKAYQYAIKAAYTGGVLSKPVLTNEAWKDMEVAYDVHVTTNLELSADSAMVYLNQENAPEDSEQRHSYAAMVEDGTAHFPAVWKGTYTLQVQKPGFDTYEATGIEILEEGSADVELKEALTPPYNLAVKLDETKTTATFTWNQALESFFDDMESYEAFTVDEIGDYITVDLDGRQTYFWNNVMAPNKNYVGSFMVVAPLETDPAQTQSDAQPYSGEQYLACFDALNDTNDDWLILPGVKAVNGSVFSFYGKSLNSEYGYERFSVWVSTTGTNAPDGFVKISDGEYMEAADEWTKYSFDLSAYAGSTVYVAIRCVSANSFAFMVDDISVGVPVEEETKNGYKALQAFNVFLDEEELASGVMATEYLFEDLTLDKTYTAGVQAVYTTGVSEISTLVFVTGDVAAEVLDALHFSFYPNPVSDVLRISSEQAVEEVLLLDFSGRLVLHAAGDATELDLSSLASGTYLMRVRIDGKWASAKVVKR